MRLKRIVSAVLSASLVIAVSINAFSATTSNVKTEREETNAALARTVAAQGMVLLENNENALPITDSAQSIALFGNGAIRTVRGGTGSGDPFNGGLSGGGDVNVNQSDRYHVNIYDSFLSAGYKIATSEYLEEWVVGYDAALEEAGSSTMDTFVYPEMELTQSLINSTKTDTDTAIYVISRNAGEGTDRSATTKTGTLNGETFVVGDYELTDVEKSNLALVGQNFDKVIVVLNVGGVIDTNFFEEIGGLDSLLLMGQGGQEGGDALVDVVTGSVTPSGKLTSTWAEQYSDYPASETFADNDDDINKEVYDEGIYVGYRYFDTFGIAPAYEFGYGKSYTDFSMEVKNVYVDVNSIIVNVAATNTGDKYSGKEVVQLYYSAPDSENSEKAYQELAAYGKTDELAPGQSQILTIKYNTVDMAYYDEAQAAYILDAGDYTLRVGNSSRNTTVSGVISLDATTITEQLSNQLTVPEGEELNEISKQGATNYKYSDEAAEIANATVYNLSKSDFPDAANNASIYDDETVNTYTTDPDYVATQDYENVVLVEDKSGSTLLDVYNGTVSMEEFIAQMSVQELATLNCGSGWGVANENSPIVGSNSDTIPGAAGETTVNYFDTYGIPSIVVADGPGGVRVAQEYTATDVNTGKQETYYQYCTAWPVSFVRAQTWDTDLLYQIGVAFGIELEELGITIVLGPSLNIHRDPLCGRNFEYYSEDPIVSGINAAAVTLGVQSIPGVGACLKHYAANNQESNRNAVDTIVSERVLREIYLKGFEIAVKSSQPMSIMTSYNLINGIPTADSYDLNTDIARGEWGFDGLIMTDWNGGSSTPSISMHAGNDLIMPGGTSRANNIVSATMVVESTFDEKGQIGLQDELMYMFEYQVAAWGDFTLTTKAEATNTVVAQLGEGYTATVDANGYILVNGENIYTDYESSWWAGTGNYTTELTTDYADISTDGKEITYYGILDTEIAISLGDVQKSAINNLNIIMQSIAMEEFYSDEDIVINPYSGQFDLATYVTVTKSDIYEDVTISLNASELSLKEGESAALIATVSPSFVDETVTWSSSNDSIATVNQAGVITAVKEGSATITAQLPNGASATCAITVDAKDDSQPAGSSQPSGSNDASDGKQPSSGDNTSSSKISTSTKTTTTASPRTGDSTQFIIAVFAISAAAVLIAIQKRNNKA